MSSSVFFKFKSSKEPTIIKFDGTGISVFELKQEIINVSGLGDGTNFDLSIYNEETGEEYDDDTTIVPRATSVVARRLPASKPGHGRAARYISGKKPIQARNRTEASHKLGVTASKMGSTGIATGLNEAQTEEERIAAMFKAGGEQWEQQQQEMASHKPVYKGGFKAKQANVPDHDPPPGYICYRCHEKGHWIQACPTNDDPNFETKPRIKRTTGIPRSFLKTVEKPTSVANDGTNEEARQPAGLMINAEGEYVIAEPDKASWEQFQAKAKASAAQQEAATADSKELQKRGLECPIDKRLFVDPVKTPCCGKTYCNECIENALVNSDLVCPNCQKEGVLLDDLNTDEEMLTSIKAYEVEKAAARKAKDKSESPSPVNPDHNKQDDTKVQASSTANSKAPVASTKILSPKFTSTDSDKKQSDSPAVSKKRPAETQLQNPRSNPVPPINQHNYPLRNGTPNHTPVNHMHLQLSHITPQQYNGDFMPNYSYMNGAGPMHPNAIVGMGTNMNGQMNMSPEMMNSMLLQGGVWPVGDGGYPHYNGMYDGGYNSEPMNHNGWTGNQGWNINGMNSMNGINGMHPMNNVHPVNGMNGMTGMGGMDGMNGGVYGMNNMGYPQTNHHNIHSQPNGKFGRFPVQQRTNFGGPAPNEEDNAYFRKPVNPYRHNNRQRRLRPSEYTEL